MPIIQQIRVDFPHQNPYDVQTRFMEKVILAIRNSENGVLESPTGTGKTLSLLCAGLACIEIQQAKMNDFERLLSDYNDGKSVNPQITEVPWMSKLIYTSRTHSQLKQAMKELRATRYKEMKSAILGSRRHLCINAEIQKTSKTENIDRMCKSKVKRKECSFFETCEALKCDESFLDSEIKGKVLDIEDLVALGTEKQFCPYYMSQHLAERADIVFSPYNYVLDERIRCRNKKLFAIVKNGIIVVDEAHNVPQLCEDLASIEFTYDDILTALGDIESVSELLPLFPLILTTFDDTDLTHLKGFIERFRSAIGEMVILTPLCGLDFDGEFIFTLMDKSDIAYHSARNIIELIDKIFEFLAEARRLSRCGRGLRKFSEILWVPFSDSGEEFRADVKTHYKVYAALKKDEQSKVVVPHVKKYNFWCCTAKFVLEKLVKQMHTRSIIFTSGTMSPLQQFIESLCVPIDIELQNQHIVDRSNVLVQIVPSGSDGERLDSSYYNRSTPAYIKSLGRTILSLCSVIPDGLLIFFTSYNVLNICKDKWQASGIWSQIQGLKKIFIEAKLKKEFSEAMDCYYANISDPRTKGAIFIGVCRGKVAEGLDFADTNGRGVIITGIPYPPLKDPKVILKRRYIDDLRGSQTGQDWYQLEASRAVNQAIGRIIRHKNDFGAILLLDCRFNELRNKSQLSTWIRNHLSGTPSVSSFGTVISSIAQFFRRHQTSPNRITSRTIAIDPLPQPIGIETEASDSVPLTAIQYNLMYENVVE